MLTPEYIFAIYFIYTQEKGEQMETQKEKYSYLLKLPLRVALKAKELAKDQERTMAKYILIAVQEKIDRDTPKLK